MSIVKEKNGTYSVNYSLNDVASGLRKRTKKRGFKTLKEAKKFEQGLSSYGTSATFLELFEESQATKIQQDNTLDEKRSLLHRYLPSLEHMPYGRITKPFLSSLQGEINKLELSAERKNKLISIIRSTLKYANDVYDLPDNSKILRRFKIERQEMEIWSPEEFQLFEDALANRYPSYVPFFHLLFNTGIRKGEARSLRTTDVDPESMTVSITKAMRRSAKSEKSPKTSSSYRRIRIDAKTMEMLLPLLDNEKYLFGDYKPFNNNSISIAWKYGIKESGVKPIRIHSLRHSHASYLLCNGINIVAVSKRLGHSSINETLSTYAHLIENGDDMIMDLLNGSQSVATDKRKAL